MKKLITFFLITLEINCALSKFKRKLIGTNKEYSDYVKKMKTDDSTNEVQTSNVENIIIKKANYLHEKAWDIYRNFSEPYRFPFKSHFKCVDDLSEAFILCYNLVYNMKCLRWLDIQASNIFRLLKEQQTEITFTSFFNAYNISETNLAFLEALPLDKLILLEFIKLQTHFSLVPELMILTNIIISKFKKPYLLMYLRILNSYINTIMLDNESLLKHKENIMSFIEEIYRYTMYSNSNINFKDHINLKFKNEYCKQKHKDLIVIFIMILPAKQRNMLLSIKNQSFGRIKQTKFRSQHFLVACYLMLYRHLLLNVVVQNKNYDMSLIDEFMKKNSVNNSCIGCMIQDCFNILKLPVK